MLPVGMNTDMVQTLGVWSPPRGPTTAVPKVTPLLLSTQVPTIVGTLYYFQVRGQDSDGNTGPEAQVNAIQRAVPPAVPNLQAEVGNAQVTLTWTHLANYNIVSYEFRQDDGAGFGETWSIIRHTVSEGKASGTVTGLSNGTTYRFQVRGTNIIKDEAKYGPDGEFVSATPSGPPAAPSDLTVQVSSSAGTEVKLTWANPSDTNIDKYRYRVNAALSGWEPGTGEGWVDIASSDATTTTYTVTGLTQGFGYELQVRSIDSDRAEGDRAGGHSSVTGTPTTSETPPAKMTNVLHTVTDVSGGSGGKVRFTWDDPGDGSINKYQYRYDYQSNIPSSWYQDWTDITGSSDTTTSYPTSADGTVDIPGSKATVFYQFRAVNTDPEPDLAGVATNVVVERANSSDDTTPPVVAPAKLKISPSGTDPAKSVIVSWDKPREPVTQWQRKESIDGGDYPADWTAFAASDFTETTEGDVTRLNWEKTASSGNASFSFKNAPRRAGKRVRRSRPGLLSWGRPTSPPA